MWKEMYENMNLVQWPRIQNYVVLVKQGSNNVIISSNDGIILLKGFLKEYYIIKNWKFWFRMVNTL